jgi:polycomb protein EED
VDGHRDEVLAADIDITGSRIVSSGMDHSLKVWKLRKQEIENAIALSYTYDSKSSR